MKRYPIVIQGDWMQLTYEEAEDRESALLAAATRWVEWANKEYGEECQLHLDPAGVQGRHTPTVGLQVLDSEGETESIWTVPDEHN